MPYRLYFKLLKRQYDKHALWVVAQWNQGKLIQEVTDHKQKDWLPCSTDTCLNSGEMPRGTTEICFLHASEPFTLWWNVCSALQIIATWLFSRAIVRVVAEGGWWQKCFLNHSATWHWLKFCNNVMTWSLSRNLTGLSALQEVMIPLHPSLVFLTL